ncbi:MAG: hypothetical protein QM648_03180 [Solirubrobacterales bacterium]
MVEHGTLESRSAQRAIHFGFFATIEAADTFRLQMPQPEELNITILHRRFPWRDLTKQEVAAGKIGPDVDFDAFVRRVDASQSERH